MKTGVQATKEVADYISKSFTTWRSYPSKLDYSKSKSSSVSQKSWGSFQEAGVTDPATEYSSIFNFGDEVKILRIAIRKSGILSHPHVEFPLRSTEGNVLYPNLINFYRTALQNYSKYLLYPNVELESVLVICEDETEFNNIDNWTIEKIKQKIQQLIQQMLWLDSQNSLMNFFKQMSKKSKKTDYIFFYNDVKKQVETE